MIRLSARARKLSKRLADLLRQGEENSQRTPKRSVASRKAPTVARKKSKEKS